MSNILSPSAVYVSDRFYLISNTSEIHVRAILEFMQEQKPKIVEWQEDIDLSTEPKKAGGPIEIAPNIFLYLSYKVHAFKTEAENTNQQLGTPALLRKLIEDFDVDPKTLIVVSQYEKDIEEAMALGVPEKNCHLA